MACVVCKKEKYEGMTKKNIIMLIIVLVALDMLAWGDIIFGSFGKRLELFFFDVGQGDSEMISMPGNVKLLIDGGPNNGKAAASLGKVLPWGDRYIDLVSISHADLDHSGGLIDVVKRYEVGAFIYNGTGSNSESFKELARMIQERNIPVIVLGEGDTIRYASSTVEILSARGKDSNEGALVMKFTGGGVSALFDGDIGKTTETWLVKNKNIQADILKIPHHGSKFSSTQEFLAAVRPKITIIEVGKNSYGHPTREVLDRIKNVSAQLFRTDSNGMVQLVIESGMIRQSKER